MSDHLIAEANRHARSLIIERDQLRTELALLREWQREVIQNANAHHAERKDAIARAESAEREAFDWKKIARYEAARAERAEAELAGIRALADRRNERDHSQDTTHQLVAALDQALDIAQAELKAERARLDWLEENAGYIHRYNSSKYLWFAHQNLRAAIHTAMKEGAE